MPYQDIVVDKPGLTSIDLTLGTRYTVKISDPTAEVHFCGTCNRLTILGDVTQTKLTFTNCNMLELAFALTPTTSVLCFTEYCVLRSFVSELEGEYLFRSTLSNYIYAKGNVQLINCHVDTLNCKSLDAKNSYIDTIDGPLESNPRFRRSTTAPSHGTFYMWKLVETCETEYQGKTHAIACLRVPARAKRCGTTKIRVSEAYVVELYKYHTFLYSQTLVPFSDDFTFVSLHDSNFVYKKGTFVRPTEPFDESSATCSSGIHGYLNPQDL